eukprot:g2889.t1
MVAFRPAEVAFISWLRSYPNVTSMVSSSGWSSRRNHKFLSRPAAEGGKPEEETSQAPDEAKIELRVVSPKGENLEITGRQEGSPRSPPLSARCSPERAASPSGALASESSLAAISTDTTLSASVATALSLRQKSEPEPVAPATANDDFPCPENPDDLQLSLEQSPAKQSPAPAESGDIKVQETKKLEVPSVAATSTWCRAWESLKKPFDQDCSAGPSDLQSNSLQSIVKGMILGIILGYLVNHAINKNRRIAMREMLEERDKEIKRLVSLLEKYMQIPALPVLLKYRL